MSVPCRDGGGAVSTVLSQNPSSPEAKGGGYLGGYQRKLHSFGDSSSPVGGGGAL